MPTSNKNGCRAALSVFYFAIACLAIASNSVLAQSELSLESPVQSSTAYNGVASRAIDGNTNGVWRRRSVTHTSNESEAWWSANLESPASISEIQIWNRTNCCTTRLSDFYVLVSDNPFESSDLATTLSDVNVWSVFHSGAVVESVSIPVYADGQYIRIQLEGKNPLSLAEVVVFGDTIQEEVIPPTNTAPQALADSAVITSDAPIVLDVVANDTDAEGLVDATTVTAAEPLPAYGSITVNSESGAITYTPDSNVANGTEDTFGYTVADTDGEPSNIGMVTITFDGPVNQAPVAVDDFLVVSLGTPTDINVVANDTDAEGLVDASTVLLAEPSPGFGSISVDSSTGVITYTSNNNVANGTEDTFGYTVADTDGELSNIGMVTVTFDVPVNQAPVAVDDFLVVSLGTPTDINVVANDTDAEGLVDASTVLLADPSPGFGSVSVDSSTGVITYTSNNNVANGTEDTFGYTVADTDGELSNIGLVTITFDVPVNQAPVAVDDFLVVSLGTPTDINVVANDTDAEGLVDASTVLLADPSPSFGSISVDSSTGVITYTSDISVADGTQDVFAYTVEDADGQQSSVATVTVLVEAEFAMLPLESASQSSTAYNGWPGRAIDGDTNGVWRGWSVTHTANESQPWWLANLEAVASISEIQIWNRTNCCTARLSDFYVLVSDSPFASTDLTTTLNDANVWSVFHSGAVDEFVSLPVGVEGRYVRVQLEGKNPLSLAEVVVLGAPFVAPVVNQAPLAVDDTVNESGDALSVDVGGSVTIAVLSNDSDSDGTLNVQSVVTSLPEQAVAQADGTIVYTPGADVETPVTFTYTVEDDDSSVSNPAAVTVTVIPVTEIPLVDQAFAAHPDFATTVGSANVDIDVLKNDTGDYDPTSVETYVYQQPVYGRISIDSTTGVITYMPYGYEGTLVDVFGYRIRQPNGNGGTTLSNVGEVTVTITSVDTEPFEADDTELFAADDTATVAPNSVVEIAVLDNDSGSLDGATVDMVDSHQAANGTVALNAEASTITYTPNVGESGLTDTFGYTITTSDNVVSNAATVTVTISELVSDALAVNDTASVEFGAIEAVIDVLNNDIASNDAGISTAINAATNAAIIETLQITVAPNFGLATVDLGQVLYTHTGTDLVADTFTYSLTDNQGVVSTATVAITIESAPNQAPVAANDAVTVTAYDAVVIDVLLNDTDADGDEIDSGSIAIVEDPEHGLVTLVEGVLTYTHDGSADDVDSFSYTVTDIFGLASNAAVVSVDIAALAAEPPVAVDDTFSLVVGATATFDILANDTDRNDDLDLTQLVIVDAPKNGVLTLPNLDGTVVYQHDGGVSESDFFTYKAVDLNGAESTDVATVSITLLPVEAPQLVDDVISLAQGEMQVIDVLANDITDTEFDPASLQITEAPEHALEVEVVDGAIVYTHRGNGSVTDTIKYKVSNMQGVESDTDAQLTITISAPLVTISDLSYQGAFALPPGEFGESELSYAQGVIEVNDDSMFIVGHRHQQAIAEFVIPTLVDSNELSALNTASSPVQGFSTVIDHAAAGNPQTLDQITGLALIDGQLVVNLMEYYDAAASNTHTTMVIKDASQLATSEASAFHAMNGAARAAGWISEVPEMWWSTLEAEYISGHASGDPIIARHSVGPSAFALNLADGLMSSTSVEIPTTELQGYSLDLENRLHADLFNETGSNALWTHLSRTKYGFIVPGTGTYMTIGSSGGHESGLGYKLVRSDGECPGYCSTDIDDMHNYYWLWDVQDWLRVKSGELEPHEVMPYEYGKLELPFENNGEFNDVGGASYDAETGLLYISIPDANVDGYSLTPVVVAYRISTPVFSE